MRPVEIQPAIVQAPNVERVQQQQQAQPQVAQQAFAGQLERTAAMRLSQVLPSEPRQEAHPADVLSEDRGEKPRRRRPGRGVSKAAPPDAGLERPPSGADGSTVDVVV